MGWSFQAAFQVGFDAGFEAAFKPRFNTSNVGLNIAWAIAPI